MQLIKKLLEQFHSIESFKKNGFKQLSTWAGVLLFILIFNDELFILVHNALTSASLTEKLSAMFSGAILVMFKGRK